MGFAKSSTHPTGREPDQSAGAEGELDQGSRPGLLDVLGRSLAHTFELTSLSPPNIAAALRLVCVEGQPLGMAAIAVALGRSTLSRRMDAFCPRWREAA